MAVRNKYQPYLHTPEHNRHLLALLCDLWDHPRQEALQRVLHELAHGNAKLYVRLKHEQDANKGETLAEHLMVIPGEGDMPSLLTWITVEFYRGIREKEPAHLGRVPTPRLLRYCDELGITNVVLDFDLTRVIYLRRSHVQEAFTIRCSQFEFWDAQPEKPLNAMTRKDRLARLRRR